VTQEEFPADVGRLITDHIDSVAQLEVLLLLRGEPARDWTVDEVSAALRMTADMSREQLRILSDRSFLARAEGEASTWRYAPSTPELGRLVDSLAALYEERRVTVITMIYSKPVDKVRTFADAFRLRKEN
jgi:hypothetical protein